MEETIKAVGYARFSSSMQREESITAQKRYMMMYAKRNNMEVIDWYCDEAKSAKTVNRPAFQKMINDAKNNPEFKAVLVHKTDRFSRNLSDSIQYKKLLEEYGVQVIFVNERFENNPESHLLYHIMGSVNQFYNENLAREVMKGLKENAYQCKFTGGRPPLGYDVDKDLKLVINEKEAEAVRLIFEMSAEGYGYGETIDKLNILGYKTKKGLPFVKNSLYEILRNEKYKGTYIFNRSCSANSLNKRNNHRRKPEEEIIRIENGCPAIVSSGLWHRANAVKKATRSSYTNAKNTYLLTGLIHCGECGGKFHGNVRYNKNNTNLVYRCSSKKNKRKCESKEIRCEYLDSFVIDKFVEFFFNDDNIKVITKQLNEQYNKSCISDLEYNEAKSTLKILEKSRNNLIEAIAKTGINDIMSDKIKEYEEQIKKTAEFMQSVFMSPVFRIYTSPDMLGVEIGAALKNVIALAAGTADGLGCGDNTKAALITRGIAEIARLGIAMGGKQQTFYGLSGIGDLIVTCASMHSRNRRAGILIGKGYTMDEAMKEVQMVVEGVYSAKAGLLLAQKYGCDMPIVSQVNQVLFDGKSPKEALADLMMRDPRIESSDLPWEG